MIWHSQVIQNTVLCIAASLLFITKFTSKSTSRIQFSLFFQYFCQYSRVFFYINVHTPLDKEVPGSMLRFCIKSRRELFPSLKWATANHVASSTSRCSSGGGGGGGLKGCIQGLNWLLQTQTDGGKNSAHYNNVFFYGSFVFIS